MTGKILKFGLAMAASLLAGAGAGKTIVVPKDIPSIQQALDAATEGDTVYVLNGRYSGSVTLREHVALIGQDMENTILAGKRRGAVVHAANYSVIRNFTISNGDKGILCENTNTLIENTIIRDNKTGIHCLISLPTIRNNLIVRNRWSGIFCELVTYGSSTALEHNIIAENGYCGLVLARRSAVLVQNNVFYRNNQFGIFVDLDSKRSRIIYNNFFGNRMPFSQYAVVDETNIARDPQYFEAGGGTYHYLRSAATPLQGMGKDGADIGLMSDADRKRIVVDSDADRIPDEEDMCPDLKEDLDEFEDQDGCPDYDNDLDGIYDQHDQCPTQGEDADGFMDDDGCPEPDNDRDGICDPWVTEKGLGARYATVCKGSDLCPLQPETVNGYKDDDGCPDTAPPDGSRPTQSLPSDQKKR